MLTGQEAPDHVENDPEGEVGLGEDSCRQRQQRPDNEDDYRQAACPDPSHLVRVCHCCRVFFLAVNDLHTPCNGS